MAAEGGVDGLIVRQGQITEDVLRASPHLKVVVKHGVGVDNIDIEAASDLGIPVCITPFANYEAVAEHTLALMFSLARNLINHDQRLHKGIWEKMADQGCELLGKYLGIIGLGRIGYRLAELVEPLGMHVSAFDPYLDQRSFPKNIIRVDTLPELLKEADFISLHCPKTAETTNMIGEEELELMKPTAILINTARGGIVDESALIRSLLAGTIGGAALDCFDREPLPLHSPLLTIHSRLLLTPHIGGVTHESMVRMGTDAVLTLLAVLDGKRIEHDVVVNRDKLHGFS